MCLQALTYISNSVSSGLVQVAELQHLQISQLCFLKGGLFLPLRTMLNNLCHQYLSVLWFEDFSVPELSCVVHQ